MQNWQSGGPLRLASRAALPALTILLVFAGQQAQGQAPTFYLPDPDEPKGTFEVQVTDPEGIPIAGAWVDFKWRSPGRLDRPGWAADPTDESGFLVRELPLAAWSISAHAPGYLPASVPPVQLTAGEVARVELVLVPVETTEVTVRVTGPVPGGGDEIVPIEGARLGFGLVRGETFYSGHGTTDADGRAVFETVAAGTYSLVVEHPLYPKGSSIHRVTTDTRTVEARLDAPSGGWAPVSGRVVRDGKGVAGAEVSLYQQRRTRSYHFDTVTGEDGRFAFSAVPVGEHTLFWQPGDDPDYPRLLENGVAVRSPGTHGLELPLPRGADVRGRVENLGDSGGPVEVSAWLDPSLSDGRIEGEVDDEGHFHLRNIIPGRWRIEVRAGRQWALRELVVPERVALKGGEIVLDPPIALPDVDERVTVTADPAPETRSASVVGRVVDGMTGEAIPGARLWLLSLTHHHPTGHRLLVEDDGSFTTDLLPLLWRFSITAPGYSPIEYEIDLRSEENGPAGSELELVLAPTAGLALHVTMDDGGVPPAVWLRLRDPDESAPSDRLVWLASPGTAEYTRTLGDPVIVWKDAAAGRWVLDVRTPAGGLVTQEVEIAARGTATPVAVVLPSTGSVLAVVLGVRSKEMLDPSELRFTLTDAGGEVLEVDCESCRRFGANELIARDVPPGRYVATVRFADGRSWSAEVEVMPGEQSEVELLPEGSS